MIVSFPSISITFPIVGLFLPPALSRHSPHGNPHDSYTPHILILNVGAFMVQYVQYETEMEKDAVVQSVFFGPG